MFTEREQLKNMNNMKVSIKQHNHEIWVKCVCGETYDARSESNQCPKCGGTECKIGTNPYI